ncbi:MAG: hypothetical protein RLZZ516_338 [Cyanobacteriota bacterium]
MRSACSDGSRSRRSERLALPLMTLALGLTLHGAALQGAALAESRWAQGVFPVSRFVGYTSQFGQRNGSGGQPETHTGLDIAAPLGSAVRSWWSGRVQAVLNNSSCGVGLVIRSGDYEHTYCHLGGRTVSGEYRSGAVRLRAGSSVRGGQTIGHVGISGRSSGPHLHWAVSWRGRWLNPGHILRAMVAARQR